MIETLVELSWRAYPGGALLALGGALVALGIRLGAGSLRPARGDLESPVRLVRGMRLAIIGLSLAALAASWVWGQLWLFILALAFGGEELLETSTMLFAMRRGRGSVHA
jgi:hypothetical protein